MKFVYHYKTSDGERHDGVYFAASKDAVYSELKEKGVRPFGVELAPGFVNRVLSVGKRGFAILILSLVTVFSIYFSASSLNDAGSRDNTAAEPTPRHQIYGDPARLADFARRGYEQVFSHPGEQYLAHFAQPGVIPDGTTLKRLPVSSLALSLTNEVVISSEDCREARELKQIVLWMKDELREYLADGVGTSAMYVKRLNQRLHEEVGILKRANVEVESGGIRNLDKVNERLRSLGLKTIVSSDETK